MTKTSHQQGSEPLYFEQHEFADNDDNPVFHAFFSRRGGVSKDVYASLNCGPGSDDNAQDVMQNRQIVSEIVGCRPENLLSLHQIHSPQCIKVSQGWAPEDRPQADAFVTDQPGLALGVLTADCAPVLFYGQKSDGRPVVGAAHAGWGGALKGVLAEAVNAMQELDAELESIRAAIGPCISKASYEVGQDFADAFLEEDEANEVFFMAAKREGHLMFDLPGYCALKLAKAGLKTVFIKDLDTYFNEEDFFSYRRKTHRGEKDYGRQISLIMIKEQ